ncbi:hypothetical protein HWV07_19515 [Natronomonas salina]|uniref:DUF7556 family protein n=1 Tax=Natronomonas salina TaxID=1710540 RepID=UPI0015B46B59|nr:hypothetical protein [Natronomonas salina]QLD91115.1 hypothetical protein HWV07_19515 [Natronomonas salina]
MSETTDIIKTKCERRVQASYDECDGEAAFVIADVSTDEAWLAVPAGEETTVSEQR